MKTKLSKSNWHFGGEACGIKQEVALGFLNNFNPLVKLS